MINPQARVWVYQSNVEFTDKQVAELKNTLGSFTETWTAHNHQLKADYEIKYKRFIVLIVDETRAAAASGCSIDKSVHLIQDLEEKFGLNLLDRFNVAYKEGDVVKSVNRTQFEELIASGSINQSTIVFDNTVGNYADYKDKWETTVANSWHSRVFSV